MRRRLPQPAGPREARRPSRPAVVFASSRQVSQRLRALRSRRRAVCLQVIIPSVCFQKNAGDDASRRRRSGLQLNRRRLQSLHRPVNVHRGSRMETFELQRRHIAQCRMAAARVVPSFHEIKHGRPRLGVRRQGGAVEQVRTRASRRSSRPSHSSKPQNAPGAVEAPQILITHPFHPLRGDRFPFVVSKSLWGEDWVTVQRPDGTVWSIPVGWTDFATPDPAVVAGRGRAPYRLEDLLRLAEMVSERVRT